MLVTIFTPTYNRAYRLPALYESLKRQTNDNFEWLIVDDGSTDNTEDLVNLWINERKINIRYIKKRNGGKHTAINRGVSEAKGEWFFIVDSDDCLTADAVEWILKNVKPIQNDNRFAGLSGVRVASDGSKIGSKTDFGCIDANAIDIRLKHKITGDLAEVFKTQVLRQFPFPEIEGEKFCPEALVWHRVARQYIMRYVFKGMYVCEYLPDGLTAKITKLRHDSAESSMIYYSEHFHDNISIYWKIKAAINYWRFYRSPYKTQHKMHNPLSFACWLPGKIMALSDRKV